MKKIKKILLMLLMLSITLVETSCGAKDVKKEPIYACKHEQIVLMPGEISNISDSITEDTDIQMADELVQEKVSVLATDIVEYLNNEYNLGWDSKPIDVYETDVASIVGQAYSAIFDPKAMAIYIQKGLLEDEENLYRIAHELVHYLKVLNTGKIEFVIDIQDCWLGYYFMESITDLITIEYFESKGDSAAREYFYVNSGYSFSTTACFMLEKLIPDLQRSYCIDDIENIHQQFNQIAEKTIDVDERVDVFYQFLYGVDFMNQATIKYAETLENAYIDKIAYGYYETFETVALMSNLYDEKTKELVIQDVWKLFKAEKTEDAETTKEFVEFLEERMS